MNKLYSLGLALLMAFTVTGCELYFDDNDDDFDGPRPAPCELDGRCPSGGGNDCKDNEDCAAGCYCVIPPGSDTGKCEETGFCRTDADCPEGFHCDDRQSCVKDDEPPPPPPAACTGTIAPTCTNGRPRCPAGQVPLIANGCYVDTTGDGQFDCAAVASCEAPPVCRAYQHEADCEAAVEPATGNECKSIKNGINCAMPDGSACGNGQPGCVCERLVFDKCEPGTTPPAPVP